jgi:hypothetical protein
MTRLILGLLLSSAIGCSGMQPVGPFADKLGSSPIKPKGKPGKDTDKDAPPPPVTVPAVKPTPPLNLIYPDEVLPENPQEAVYRLMSELEADRKSMPAPPRTAEVSHYKGGVKQ